MLVSSCMEQLARRLNGRFVMLVPDLTVVGFTGDGARRGAGFTSFIPGPRLFTPGILIAHSAPRGDPATYLREVGHGDQAKRGGRIEPFCEKGSRKRGEG
jgi:hypothetical protein